MAGLINTRSLRSVDCIRAYQASALRRESSLRDHFTSGDGVEVYGVFGIIFIAVMVEIFLELSNFQLEGLVVIKHCEKTEAEWAIDKDGVSHHARLKYVFQDTEERLVELSEEIQLGKDDNIKP
eukprot:scaffold187589_cov37-Tisochrysis_lutea.AAC.1